MMQLPEFLEDTPIIPYIRLMRKFTTTSAFLLLLNLPGAFAQVRLQTGADQAPKDPIVEAIIKEAQTNSQLKPLAHQLIDSIGPRLVGTPQMESARDWALAKYKSWGI